MLPIKTILCPVDFSEPSQQAYRVARVAACNYAARLVVVHVLPQPMHAYREFGPRDMDGALAEREVLESLQALYPGHRRIEVDYRVCRGQAAGEIITLARTLKPELIVMGTHGRAGVGRLLLGSVTEAVLRRAPCPVLTVRAPVPATSPAAPAEAEPVHA